MKVHLVQDRHGPLACFADRADADSFVERWKVKRKVRRVWVLTMALSYGQIL